MSALELLLGAFLVIGGCVFYTVPGVGLILVLLGLLSIRLRNGGWSVMGFTRPASWGRIIQLALAAAALRIILGTFVGEWLAGRYWPPVVAPEAWDAIPGNITAALFWLVLVWIFGAFGEEVAFRGYLLTRAAEIGGRTTAAYWLGIVGVAVLFGYAHYYKGPTGILSTGISGVILGAVYMLSGRNLWASILAHGFINTFAVMETFFEWEFLSFD